MPCRQLPYHECFAQNIQVMPHRVPTHPQRTPDLRRVPSLPMAVRQHRPKPTQMTRRNSDSQLRNIPFQKPLHESLPPSRRIPITPRQKRKRIPATHPMRRLRSHFGIGKRSHLDRLHPSSQALCRPLDQYEKRKKQFLSFFAICQPPLSSAASSAHRLPRSEARALAFL
jgi:hypothetical protein